MARPGKTKVDYFPHVTQTGKTIAILEARWGNDGYAFWFKVLELLGSSEGFFYDCNRPSDWEYLLSKTRVTEATATAILDKLAEIDAIDADIWGRKVIWSDHFAGNLTPVFDKRKSQPPQRPEFPERKPDDGDSSESLRDENPASEEFPVPETDKEKHSIAEQSEAEHSKRDDARAGCPSSRRPNVVRQADTVYLTEAERDRLAADYGEEGAGRIIALLDAYKSNQPKKCREYRDDFKAITTWVIRRYLEERAGPGAGGRDHFFATLNEMAGSDAM
jgi:hypothetical protein